MIAIRVRMVRYYSTGTGQLAMRKARIAGNSLFLMITYAVIYLPIIASVVLSLVPVYRSVKKASDWAGFEGYEIALTSPRIRDAWVNSVTVAVPVALATAIIAFLISLVWWSKTARAATFLAITGMVIIPPDVYALGLQSMGRLFGADEASLILVGISHVAWALPFCVVMLFIINSAIKTSLFGVAMELGASRLGVIRRVILPISLLTCISALFLAFVLSVNEYTRASYLSGSREVLSQYIFGQMASGGDSPVYAIATLNILAAAVVVVVIGVTLRVSKEIAKSRQDQGGVRIGDTAQAPI
jgi:spermidine/putrescine transport system permease protein